MLKGAKVKRRKDKGINKVERQRAREKKGYRRKEMKIAPACMFRRWRSG